jgi:hypothetical protein
MQVSTLGSHDLGRAASRLDLLPYVKYWVLWERDHVSPTGALPNFTLRAAKRSRQSPSDVGPLSDGHV